MHCLLTLCGNDVSHVNHVLGHASRRSVNHLAIKLGGTLAFGLRFCKGRQNTFSTV